MTPVISPPTVGDGSSRSAEASPSQRASGDDQATAREVIAHDTCKQALAGGVERIGRFIQQPDRPPHREQPGDRQPPPLSGRQESRRELAGMIEPHRGKAVAGVRPRAEKIPPEGEVFHHAQSRFQRVTVAEIMRLFRQAQLCLAALQPDRSATDRQQAGNQAQQ